MHGDMNRSPFKLNILKIPFIYIFLSFIPPHPNHEKCYSALKNVHTPLNFLGVFFFKFFENNSGNISIHFNFQSKYKKMRQHEIILYFTIFSAPFSCVSIRLWTLHELIHRCQRRDYQLMKSWLARVDWWLHMTLQLFFFHSVVESATW